MGPICHLSSAPAPVPEEEPPSSALASVVQHLPLELMDGVVRNLSNDDSVTDSQMLTAISRWAERQVVVRSLSVSQKPLPLGGIAGLDLVSEGSGPRACPVHPSFFEPFLCLVQERHRELCSSDALGLDTSSVTLDQSVDSLSFSSPVCNSRGSIRRCQAPMGSMVGDKSTL